MIGSGLVIFGNTQKSSENFSYLREPSEVVGRLRKLGNVGIENLTQLTLEKLAGIQLQP